MSWCARYFVRERVADGALWRSLIERLAGIALHRVVEAANRPMKAVIAQWYRLMSLRHRGDHGESRR
jgi:hypothetical protein